MLQNRKSLTGKFQDSFGNGRPREHGDGGTEGCVSRWSRYPPLPCSREARFGIYPAGDPVILSSSLLACLTRLQINGSALSCVEGDCLCREVWYKSRTSIRRIGVGRISKKRRGEEQRLVRYGMTYNDASTLLGDVDDHSNSRSPAMKAQHDAS